MLYGRLGKLQFKIGKRRGRIVKAWATDRVTTTKGVEFSYGRTIEFTDGTTGVAVAAVRVPHSKQSVWNVLFIEEGELKLTPVSTVTAALSDIHENEKDKVIAADFHKEVMTGELQSTPASVRKRVTVIVAKAETSNKKTGNNSIKKRKAKQRACKNSPPNDTPDTKEKRHSRGKRVQAANRSKSSLPQQQSPLPKMKYKYYIAQSNYTSKTYVGESTIKDYIAKGKLKATDQLRAPNWKAYRWVKECEEFASLCPIIVSSPSPIRTKAGKKDKGMEYENDGDRGGSEIDIDDINQPQRLTYDIDDIDQPQHLTYDKHPARKEAITDDSSPYRKKRKRSRDRRSRSKPIQRSPEGRRCSRSKSSTQPKTEKQRPRRRRSRSDQTRRSPRRRSRSKSSSQRHKVRTFINLNFIYM